MVNFVPFVPNTDPFGPTNKVNPSLAPGPSDTIAPSDQISAVAGGTPTIGLQEYYQTVSDAIIKQRLQALLTLLSDQSITNQLFGFGSNQATQAQAAIILAENYENLQLQLDNLDVPDAINTMQSAQDTFNNYVHTTNATQTGDLNTAIDTFNNDESSYQSSLVTYNNAVQTYQGANNNYQSALNAYQAALAGYPNSVNQSQLDAAQANFVSAQNTFDNAQTTFNSTNTQFNTLQNQLLMDKQTLDSQVTTYNSSITTAVSTLNDAINTWNHTATEANTLINQMNTIRTQTFNLPAIPLAPTGGFSQDGSPQFPLASFANSLFSEPASGPDSARDTALTSVNTINGTINTSNNTITNVNGLITSDNQAYTQVPSIPLPTAVQTTLGHFPIIGHAPGQLIFSWPGYTSPASLTFDELIGPLANILNQLEAIEQRATNAVNLADSDVFSFLFDPKPKRRKLALGGPGGSVAMTTANQGQVLASPFLGGDLSQAAFQAFFNTAGVPVGSDLVDQIGALYKSFQQIAGLAAAGPAGTILANGALGTTGGGAAIGAAAALGQLSQIVNLTQGTQITAAVTSLVNSNPQLAALSDDVKAQLIRNITGELGSSLLKSALEDVARNLGLPGLVPQLLAQLPGAGNTDVLASFQEQLFDITNVTQALQGATTATQAQLQEIVTNAFQQAGTNPFSAASIAAVQSSIIDQLTQIGAIQANTANKVSAALDTAHSELIAEQNREDAAKTDALQSSIAAGLEADNISSNQAQQIATTIANNNQNITVESIIQQLIQNGIDAESAQNIAINAVSASQNKDGTYNPLGTFLLQQVGEPNELAAYFKIQVTDILAPVVGQAQALQVAEDYGNLIFTASDSVLNTLQTNERDLRKLNKFNAQQRSFEDYTQATIGYSTPALDPSNPLNQGKTLLVLAGGASTGGVLSGDTAFGPGASKIKHATDYGSILG